MSAGVHRHDHENMAPAGAVALACLLVCFSLLLAVAVRVGWLSPQETATQVREAEGVKPAVERLLRFRDSPDGHVIVEDARTGLRVATIGEEGSGFIRGVMRGLARERRQHGIGEEPPFRLVAWANGTLSLIDPSTGRTIELDGFGHTNRDAFARLLTAPEERR